MGTKGGALEQAAAQGDAAAGWLLLEVTWRKKVTPEEDSDGAALEGSVWCPASHPGIDDSQLDGDKCDDNAEKSPGDSPEPRALPSKAGDQSQVTIAKGVGCMAPE